ncbi:MAG: penicillin-binding transpeptidase domain-containing protein [Eubacteriaceae bacterium]|nr:penicillin-binding transpeptidase domain-containing protein [Eubacteriaceae bacterium]
MRKKRIISLVAIFVVAAVAVIGTILNSVFSQKAAKPDELLQQYFVHIGNGQYERMYEMLSGQAKEFISMEDFVAKNKNIYGGIEAKNITVAIGQISDIKEYAGKIVEYSISMDTLAGEISYSNQAIFILNENKEYQMQWTTHTIFPNHNPNDKVWVRTLSASRGCIYDRNGEMLAGAGVASAIGFVPGKMRTEEEASQDSAELTPHIKPGAVNDSGNLDEIDTEIAESKPAANYNEADISKVAELLEMTPESIIRKLSASYVKEDTFVLLKTVSKEAYELEKDLLAVKGIMVTDTAVRFYPLGEKASHLIGYVQNINAEELEVRREQGYHMNSVLGKAGLEKIYEDDLRAVDGYEIVIVDENGNLIETLARKDKIDGKNLTLAIDAQIQSQLFDLFSNDKSCSVALNPKTGEVYALVSTPTYDGNDFALGMSLSKWTALNEDKNLPFVNRFKAALCPGSTMKAVTAAIAIDTGSVLPEDDFGPSGLRWRKDESWGGYYITTTMEYEGPANIRNALKFSDNIFFGKTAMKIGAGRFAQELARIGFEERIPFEFGLYSSIVSSTETFRSEIQLADSGFGQGEILTNPLHLALIYSSFINNGNILTPRLILNSSAQIWKENAFSPGTAKIIRDNLVQVIESGSAKDARVSGRTLGGKTGTAEIKQSKDDKTGIELGWFVEFTAGDNEADPLLVISMVEDVYGRGGSHYVSTKVKRLFE